MEKIKCICVMRELAAAMSALEQQLQQLHGLSFNEAMAICCIGTDTLKAAEIAENTGLSASNTSKVLRSIETKGLVERALGTTDRRQMNFTLTDTGRGKLHDLKSREINIPAYIRPLFEGTDA